MILTNKYGIVTYYGRGNASGAIWENRDGPAVLMDAALAFKVLRKKIYINYKCKRSSVVYRASTPQVLGSINGLGKVDSAFHPRCIGLMKDYQACLGS
ncbi:hypothetical protein TNCV_5035311 [Trichonephila clavipes]|nr:hypothetical protein TNCV_5035311 [Trichonephila clavipes]